MSQLALVDATEASGETELLWLLKAGFAGLASSVVADRFDLAQREVGATVVLKRNPRAYVCRWVGDH